jgi:hypothetical protein
MKTCADYHRPEPKLGYREWHADADRRIKRGQKQRRCPACKLWVWNCFFHKRKRKRK